MSFKNKVFTPLVDLHLQHIYIATLLGLTAEDQTSTRMQKPSMSRGERVTGGLENGISHDFA